MSKSSEWIPVGALGDAFLPENNCLPPVDDLTGRKLTLHFENGWVIEHHFASGCELVWTMLSGEPVGQRETERYVATRPRPGIYFVDFIKAAEPTTSVSIVLNLNNGTFVGIVGQLPTQPESLQPFLSRIAENKELTAVTGSIVRGTIDQPCTAQTSLPEATADLLGKRVEYTYSPHERYEHIYLNDRFYSWRCIAGSEKGLCDTDAAHYYKIDEQLYLFIWREKIVPTLGVVVVDLNAMKTTGKIFGYENNDFGKVRNFTVGARVRILSTILAE